MMTNTASTHRFSFTAFAIAATLCLGLNGTMLMGFNALASANEHSQAQTAQVDTETPVLVLERVVVVSTRRV